MVSFSCFACAAFPFGKKLDSNCIFSLALQTQKLCNKAKGFHGVCSKGSFKIEQENFLRFRSFTFVRSAHKIDFSIFSWESASASRIISIVITCFKPVSTLFIAHLPILLSISLIEQSSSSVFLSEHLINIIFSDFTGRCHTKTSLETHNFPSSTSDMPVANAKNLRCFLLGYF